MRVLVLGSGGREHALAWKLAAAGHEVICSPGNPGMEGDVAVRPGPLEPEAAAQLARELRADLTVVGPEAPLVAGLADFFEERGLPVVGPSRAAARLEGSKVFAKEFMARRDIPTAEFAVFEDPEQALGHARSRNWRVVVKADGLAAGKGVFVCRSQAEVEEALDQVIRKRCFGEAGRRVVLEELLEGEEASFIALCDGEEVLALAGSQDHKPLLDGDQGPNTGGMGAYSPAPVLDEATAARVMEEIVRPTVVGMAAEGAPYRGVLYAGLMITAQGPKVLEFNCRFGDPETQPLMMRLESDLGELLLGTREGLAGLEARWRPEAALCVVMAAQGYPGSVRKGDRIQGLEEVAEMENVKVFFAGVSRCGDGLCTSGGRVLGVCGLGKDVAAARDLAYEAVGRISWPGAYYRRDIGLKAIDRGGSAGG